MGVYNDMANDAGYSYGSDENEQMAQMIEWEEQVAWQQHFEEQEYMEEMERYYDILFRKF
jgi:hypothetical protein